MPRGLPRGYAEGGAACFACGGDGARSRGPAGDPGPTRFGGFERAPFGDRGVAWGSEAPTRGLEVGVPCAASDLEGVIDTSSSSSSSSSSSAAAAARKETSGERFPTTSSSGSGERSGLTSSSQPPANRRSASGAALGAFASAGAAGDAGADP